MTEEEAKTKWCPMASGRVIKFGVEVGETSRFVHPKGNKAAGPSLFCIASDCMAWRVHTTDRGDDIGYCGLAGKP